MRARALVATVAGSAAVLGAAWGVDRAQSGSDTAPVPLPAPVGIAPSSGAPGVRGAVAGATGVVAGGHDVLLEAAARPGVDVLAVTRAGVAVCSDGVRKHLMAARPASGDG